MKILLRNLLLTIAFFISFSESDCSGIYKEVSVGPSSYDNKPHPNIAPLIIHYKGRDIEVSFHMQNGHFTPMYCKVLGEHYGVPSLANKKKMNFISRALMHGGRRYCVVYETGDGVVLGAKLPPILSDQPYTGDPRDFNPDTTKCYVTYKTLDYVVKPNPVTGNAAKIELLPENISNPNSRYIDIYNVRTIDVKFGGLCFVLYERRNPDRKIVGADLDPYWRNSLP